MSNLDTHDNPISTRSVCFDTWASMKNVQVAATPLVYVSNNGAIENNFIKNESNLLSPFIASTLPIWVKWLMI